MRYLFTILFFISLNPSLSGQIQPDSIDFKNLNSANINPVRITAIRYSDSGRSLRVDSSALERNKLAPIADLLSESPSVFVKSYGQAGSATLSFRGTGAGHTQIYWNGLEINSPMLGLSDLSLASTGLFDKISMSHGSSSLYLGEGGLGGNINLENIIFFSPGYQNKIEIGQEAASFGNYKSFLKAVFREKKWLLKSRVIGISQQNNFSYFNHSLAESPQEKQVHSQVRQLSFNQELNLLIAKQHQVGVYVWGNAMNRELPPTLLTHNLSESQSDRSIRVQVKWKLLKSNRYWKANSGYHFDELHYQNGVAQIDSRSKVHSGHFSLLRYKESAWRNTKLYSNFGLRGRLDWGESPSYTEQVQQTKLSAFANFKFHLRSRWYVDFLLRETIQDRYLSLPIGKLDLQYLYGEHQQNSFYLNFNRNIRFPSLNDLFWVPGGNPDLKPENQWGSEIGLQRKMKLNSQGLFLNASLDGYASLVDNWILWTPGLGNIWSAENVKKVFTNGLETEFELKKISGKFRYRFKLAYTLSRSINLGANSSIAGKQLIYTPLHSAFALAEFSWRKYSLNYKQQLQGKRFTTSDNSQSLPGYSLADLRLDRRLKWKSQGLHLYGGIRNLFDVDYFAIAWRPMPGRSFYLGLNWNFQSKAQ